MRLYIFFSHYTFLHYSLASTFHANKSALARCSLSYQFLFEPFWQNFALDPLSFQFSGYNGYKYNSNKECAEHNARVCLDIINKQIAALEQQADPDKDIIWKLGPLNSSSIKMLDRFLRQSPVFSKREIRAIMLLEPQSRVFKQRSLRIWKNKYPPLDEDMVLPDTFGNYNIIFETLAECWGSSNIMALAESDEADSEYAFNIGRIENILGMPSNSLISRQASYPKSFAGLDIARATYSFPFSFNERIKYDRNEFYGHICEAEKNLPLISGMPAGAKEYQTRFLKENEQIAEKLGLPGLFAENADYDTLWPEYPPEIDPSQMEFFAAGLKPPLREAFLRHYRDTDQPLVKEELVFVKALEKHRKKFMPLSGFNFPKKKPVLSVLTMAYNQKDYIKECMDSITAQKTDFPVEHIIVDDCSTDGTQDIIENYASSHSHVKPIYMAEHNSGGINIRKLFSACKSEYAALCDGDDYFTSSCKLQRQADFLRQNQDCAICFHPVLVHYENSFADSFIYPEEKRLQATFSQKRSCGKFYISHLLKFNFMQTNSVVYRWRFKNGLPDWFQTDLTPADWYWHLLHAETGTIGFLPEIMAIYRRHPSSFFATSFIKSSVEHRRIHGLEELKTFDAINKHFKNKYYESCSTLAKNVFNDFFTIYTQEGDSALLDFAMEKYPVFGKDFLESINI